MFEVHDAVAARLFTTMTWLPTVAPDAALALRMLEFDEATERAAKGPVKLLST